MEVLGTLEIDGTPIDLNRLAEVCRRFGVTRLEVFGSVAREAATPESDVDLLFELGPSVRLGFRIFELETELEAAVGRPVDLLSRDSIHRMIRDAVLSEARTIYAA